MLGASGSERREYLASVLAPFGFEGSGCEPVAEHLMLRQFGWHLDATTSMTITLELPWYYPAEPPSGYVTTVVLNSAAAPTPSVAYSISEMLAVARANLSLSIVELAEVLGVERPTVYAWMANRWEPKEHNRQRLRRLFDVARHWSRVATSPLGPRLRHRDEQGVSVLSLLQTGHFDDAAAKLDQIATFAAPSTQTRRTRRLREVLVRNGLESRIKSNRDEIDLLTGKRISSE